MMALRSADLIRTAWSLRGHPTPERHLVIIAPRPGPGSRWGTLLASRRPFSDDEIRTLRRMTDRLGFDVLFDPYGRENPAAFTELFGPALPYLLLGELMREGVRPITQGRVREAKVRRHPTPARSSAMASPTRVAAAVMMSRFPA